MADKTIRIINGSVAMNALDDLLNYLSNHVNLGDSLALSSIGAVLVVFYKWHKNTSSPIDFSDLFISSKTGRMGGSEFRINLAFLLTSWALIFMTIRGALTEWYLTVYLAAFVTDRVLSRKNSLNQASQGTDDATQTK